MKAKERLDSHEMVALMLPSYCYAFLPWARHFASWAWLQNLLSHYPNRRFSLPRREAVGLLAEAHSLSLIQVRAILREGNGRFWSLDGHMLRLRHPNNLRHQSYQLVGAAKKTSFMVKASVYRQGLHTLKAVMSFPVQPSPHPIALAYVAKSAKISIKTACYYRKALRGLQMITTVPNYYEISPKLPGGRDDDWGSPIFIKGGKAYKRGLDFVIPSKLTMENVKVKTSPLRGVLLVRGESSQTMLRRSGNLWRLSDGLLVMLDKPPPKHWREFTKRHKKYLSRAKLMSIMYPSSDEVDPVAWQKLLKSESWRLSLSSTHLRQWAMKLMRLGV